MTEEERRQWRADKEKAVAKLKSHTLDWYETRYRHALGDVSGRMNTYVAGVYGCPDDHNLYEILGVLRFFDLLDRYEFDTRRARHFLGFQEHLKFSGLNGRRRYSLTPIQCFQFASIYGFVDSQGRRLCRNAYIFVPRKFSKTTGAAGMAVYDFVFGDSNSQAYVAANSHSQAKICFNEIRSIMQDLYGSEKSLRINREKIYPRDPTDQRLIECLSSDSKTKDGLNASLVIMDEYSQARDTVTRSGAALKNTLTTSMGARKEPLTVVITTASDVIDGPFARELQGAKKVLKGEIDDDSLFASIFEPDADDAEDDPHTWAKVQPHLGVTVQKDYYEQEWRHAQESADNMLAFRTKLLNIFSVSETKIWIERKDVKSAMVHFDNSTVKDTFHIPGKPVAFMSVDLSESDDFSAVTTMCYNPKAYSFYSHTAYFFPQGALTGHANEKLYRMWAEQGFLHLTAGPVIDYREIVEYILAQAKWVTILGIGYDEWKSNEMINMLAAATPNGRSFLHAVKQTYGAFTAPVQSYEHGIKTGKIFLDDNPITTFCFGNAVLDYDRLENVKPVKISQNRKIDGVITNLMCIRQFIDYQR